MARRLGNTVASKLRARFVLAARAAWLVALVLGAGLASQACGARTDLYLDEMVPVEEDVPCEEGDIAPCGSDVGACHKGQRVCVDGLLGPCEGGVGPTVETCNGLDDDCDGSVDEGFGLGEACDGADSDLCKDDVMTCAGCSRGPDTLEVCNGVNDDCDGIIDSDCEAGSCSPTLNVTGSQPSEPSCVDFPVQRGSAGTINYPCGGGPVTATLGSVSFSGSVDGGFVSLEGTEIIGSDRSPDGCVWQTGHRIFGDVSSGMLSYEYTEIFIEGVNCWRPCTESGTVALSWTR